MSPRRNPGTVALGANHAGRRGFARRTHSGLPALAQTFQLLNPADALVDAMRAARAQPGTRSCEAAEALIPWLKRLRPKDATQTLTFADAGAGTASRASALPTFDFLAAAEEPDELGRLAHYRVLAPIGAGGMGMVFRRKISGSSGRSPSKSSNRNCSSARTCANAFSTKRKRSPRSSMTISSSSTKRTRLPACLIWRCRFCAVNRLRIF